MFDIAIYKRLKDQGKVERVMSTPKAVVVFLDDGFVGVAQIEDLKQVISNLERSLESARELMADWERFGGEGDAGTG